MVFSFIKIPVDLQHDVFVLALEGPVTLCVNVHCDRLGAGTGRKM